MMPLSQRLKIQVMCVYASLSLECECVWDTVCMYAYDARYVRVYGYSIYHNLLTNACLETKYFAMHMHSSTIAAVECIATFMVDVDDDL